MKNISFFFSVILLSLLSAEIIQGQKVLNQKSVFPQGISFDYGIGNYSATDEYISGEKYSGSMPYYKITWFNQHESYSYHLSLQFQTSSDIKNYNVASDVYRFALNQGFSYALPEFSLLNCKVYTFLGPSTELFFYYNRQNIAVSGFDYSQSLLMLLSGGLSSQIFCKLSDNLNIEGSLDFGLLSLGFRMVDVEESDETPVKILTLFSGTNLSLALGPRYYFLGNLSLKAAYIFQLTRVSSWKPLLSAGDNLVITMTYGL